MYFSDIDPNSKSYDDFIRNSHHWQRVKEKYQKSNLSKYCFICFSFKYIQLHHEDYRVLGYELYGDNLRKFIKEKKLVPVCKFCHAKLTFDEAGEKIPQKYSHLRERRTELRKAYIKSELWHLHFWSLFKQYLYRLIW